MLEAYSVNQTLAANAIVPFTSVSLVKGETAVLNGTNSIQLNRSGVYMVSAVFTGTAGAAATASIAMTKDGVVQPQATVSTNPVLTTVGVVLPIVTLVQVTHDNSCCCRTAPTVIQFVNNGTALSAVNAKVVITKVC